MAFALDEPGARLWMAASLCPSLVPRLPWRSPFLAAVARGAAGRTVPRRYVLEVRCDRVTLALATGVEEPQAMVSGLARYIPHPSPKSHFLAALSRWWRCHPS